MRTGTQQARLPGATDLTQYGEGRASPKAFLTHHVANISTVIQAADAHAVLNAATGAVRASWALEAEASAQAKTTWNLRISPLLPAIESHRMPA